MSTAVHHNPYIALGASIALISAGSFLAYKLKWGQNAMEPQTSSNSTKLLTPRQAELIASQWAVAMKDPDGTAKLFYTHLFSSHPEVRHLFKTQDFVAQGK
jgi:hypothetical protein